ncbi:glycosyltransferase [Streptomyces sp. SID8361]|uniref:glycosyltransferase n=1 Tax=Streptomyces sp. MnatMP-M27 TaxID=1839768 RepID=UPI00081F1242|nr:glycosyltransferase [Streptomyces sp. MnatMP-M27]MYU16762.1 glycosyltransferase [Streptomyces sp. SID8361]SCG11328.1 N-glycosyltransferase [Streptomyces sp. MnatMP-M27]
MFTTLGSPSHGRAQLPLARSLAAAGHEVLVVTTPALTSVFEREEVRVTSGIGDFSPSSFLGPVLAEEAAQAGSPDPADEQSPARMLRLMAKAVSGPMATWLLDTVLPVAHDFRPDLILRDGMDLGSCVIAETLGIPQLSTPSGAANSFDPAAMLPGLNALRKRQGLAILEDPLSLVPHGRIDYVPPAFSFARHLPASWSYRQTVDVDRGAALPRWIAELPTDRPLMLAAIGTAIPMLRDSAHEADTPAPPMPMQDPVDTLRAMIQAVSRLEECTVVLATSGIPVDTDGVPPHVHITDRVPQPLLLESVDLFLTHGGFNSIRESLRTATPMAVLPQFGDQPGNAQRVQELGLGRHITDPTPDGIASVCREVLADDGCRARGRRARLEMLALPEIDSAVPDLEKIAG